MTRQCVLIWAVFPVLSEEDLEAELMGEKGETDEPVVSTGDGQGHETTTKYEGEAVSKEAELGGKSGKKSRKKKKKVEAEIE